MHESRSLEPGQDIGGEGASATSAAKADDGRKKGVASKEGTVVSLKRWKAMQREAALKGAGGRTVTKEPLAAAERGLRSLDLFSEDRKKERALDAAARNLRSLKERAGGRVASELLVAVAAMGYRVRK